MTSKPELRISLTRSVLALGAAAALAATLPSLAQPPGPPGETFKVVTFVEGLKNPWSMAWLPNGDMLVTERGGTLRIVRGGKLLPTPVAGVPAVRAQGQGGLQEVAAASAIRDESLHLSELREAGPGRTARRARPRSRARSSRTTSSSDVKEIFEAKAWNDAPGHFGARIAFDNQNHLFMSVGDRMAGLFPRRPDGAMDPNLAGHPAQNLGSHQGKILRLNDDGTVPADNPFVGQAGKLPEIWSYGHRNPQGLAFNPETGALWETEHGPQGGDELNLIEKGKNYGWPVIGYGANYTLGTEIHASRNKEGMEQPKAFFVPSIGISGLTFYEGDKFPNWKGNAFVGGMAGNYRQLVRFSLNGPVVTNREPLLQDQYRIARRAHGSGRLHLHRDRQHLPASRRRSCGSSRPRRPTEHFAKRS